VYYIFVNSKTFLIPFSVLKIAIMLIFFRKPDDRIEEF